VTTEPKMQPLFGGENPKKPIFRYQITETPTCASLGWRIYPVAALSRCRFAGFFPFRPIWPLLSNCFGRQTEAGNYLHNCPLGE
jgi:hypothetical protein